MNIKALREKKNITQEELSEKTGIPRARIAKWEQGKGNPKVEDLRVLENFFTEEKKVQKVEDEYGQPIIQVVLNLSYIGKKSADSIDKMADSNLLNAKSIATLVNILANSDLASQLTSAQNGRHTQEHEDDNLPAEAFLGSAGSDAIRRQTQVSKKKIGHK